MVCMRIVWPTKKLDIKQIKTLLDHAPFNTEHKYFFVFFDP